MTDPVRMRFASGHGTALALGNCVALVAAGVNTPSVELIERSMGVNDSLETVMTALSALGFGNLPGFAIIAAERQTVHLLVRGDVVVSVVGVDGTTTIHHQPAISTWREEVVEYAQEVHIELREQGSVEGPGLRYWTLGGVVSAGRLVWPVTMAAPSAIEKSGGGVRSPAATLIGPLETGSRSEEIRPDDTRHDETRHDDAGGHDDEHTAEEGIAPAAAAEPNGDGPAPHEPRLAIPMVPLVPLVSLASSFAPPLTTAVSVESESDPVEGEGEGESDARLSGEADDLDFANFVDHTVFHGAEDAAIRPVETADEPSGYADQGSGATIIDSIPGPALASTGTVGADPDHDGNTVSRPRKKGSVSGASPGSKGLTRAAMVQAVFCPQTHPNPSNASVCRVCGAVIASRTARMTARPPLGVLLFTTNRSVSVDGPIMIGRSPPAGQVVDGEIASLVEIDNSELSRHHATVHVAEWFVHVADEGSTNGTIVSVPGKPPQTLRPYEKVQLPHGASVDLGGAISFTFGPV
jgi:hypothetical protein